MTFQEGLEKYIDYLSINRLKITTIQMKKEQIYKHFIKQYGSKNIYHFTEEDFLNWQRYIIALNKSKSFEDNIQNNINGFFAYLERFYEFNNVSTKIGRFKSQKIELPEETKTWNPRTFKRFLRKTKKDTIYHALFRTLYLTGMRKGESLALDINNPKCEGFLKYYLYIHSTLTKRKFNGERQKLGPKSTNSIRKIRIPYLLYRELKALRQYYTKKYGYCNNDFYLFGGPKPISCTTLDRKKNHYCDMAKIKRIRIHDFRHSHATILFKKKINIKTIQKRLGHANISTTMNIYVHTNEKDEKRVLRKLFLQ